MDETRRFTDRFGFTWQVCELAVHASPRAELADVPSRAAGELYFFARGTTLVLRDYPSEWTELAPRELERLRERALVLGSRATAVIPRQALAATASYAVPALPAAPAMTSR